MVFYRYIKVQYFWYDSRKGGTDGRILETKQSPVWPDCLASACSLVPHTAAPTIIIINDNKTIRPSFVQGKFRVKTTRKREMRVVETKSAGRRIDTGQKLPRYEGRARPRK